MKKTNAAQKRLFQNATIIVATRLLLDALSEKYSPQLLSDVITIFNGQSLKKSERQDDGLFDVYGSGGLVGNYSEFLSEKPFVVIGRKGSAGKPTYAPFGGWVIDTAYYAQPSDEMTLDTKYLFFALTSLDFSDDIITTAIPGINRTAIYKHTIPVPPLETQIAVIHFLEAVSNKTDLPELPDFLNRLPAIVARIESLVTRINEARLLRDETEREVEALLHSAMRQIFKSDGAKIVPLETTCATIIDNLHSNPNYSGNCVVPCIRSSDVGWGELFLETARKTSEEEYTRRTVRGEPTENDIVLVREGGGTGKAALVEKHHRFSLGQRVMMLRPDQSVVLPKFLLYQILSPFIYDEQILPLSKGSASPHLNIGSLRKFKFMLPPLDEQRRIVAYLDGLQAKVNGLREYQSASGEELSALMPSILDKAFKGEL